MDHPAIPMSDATHPSKFKAVMTARCPECRTGSVFTHSPFHPSKFLNVHDECPHCKCNYEPEPGFFWGAMYINYGFNIAALVAVSLAIWLLFGSVSPWTHVIAVVITVVVTIPFTTRASRVLMLHWFGPFRFRKELFFKGDAARTAEEMRTIEKVRKAREKSRK